MRGAQLLQVAGIWEKGCVCGRGDAFLSTARISRQWHSHGGQPRHRGQGEDSGLGAVTGSHLVAGARTGSERETLRHGGDIRVGEPAGSGHGPGTLFPGKSNLLTSTLVFFTALEGNPKPQDLKFYAAAQL